MKARKTNPDIVLTEAKVLSAVAQGTTEGSIREVANATLRKYQWRDPAHQTIFKALLAIPSERPETVQSELPTRLTRMGFPDLAWEDVFAQPRLSRAEAERLIEQLSRSTPASL